MDKSERIDRMVTRRPLSIVRGAWASLHAAHRIEDPARRRQAIGISWTLIRSTVDVAGELRERPITPAELLAASGAVE